MTCAVVNYYHVYKYLCYYCLSMCFRVCMLSLSDDWVRYDRSGSVFPFYLSVDRSLSTHFRSNWFVFEIP